jgi:hypothetical protein
MDPGAAALARLHAVDLSRTDVDGIRRELMEQLGTIGFLVLTNVPGYDEPVLVSFIYSHIFG